MSVAQDQCPCPHNERIAVLDEAVKSLKHDLYGNGQPGRFDKMEERLHRKFQDLNKRFDEFDDELAQVRREITSLTIKTGVYGALGIVICQVVIQIGLHLLPN